MALDQKDAMSIIYKSINASEFLRCLNHVQLFSPLNKIGQPLVTRYLCIAFNS